MDTQKVHPKHRFIFEVNVVYRFPKRQMPHAQIRKIWSITGRLCCTRVTALTSCCRKCTLGKTINACEQAFQCGCFALGHQQFNFSTPVTLDPGNVEVLPACITFPPEQDTPTQELLKFQLCALGNAGVDCDAPSQIECDAECQATAIAYNPADDANALEKRMQDMETTITNAGFAGSATYLVCFMEACLMIDGGVLLLVSSPSSVAIASEDAGGFSCQSPSATTVC